MSSKLTLPHATPDHWEKVKEALSNTIWTPHSFITAVDTIRISAYKQVKPMPSESRFSGLLSFFKDPMEVSAPIPEELWGGYDFSYLPSAEIKGWFFKHTLPFIVRCVLELPSLFSATVLSLDTADVAEQKMDLTKEQCTAIVACSFLNAFHHTAAPRKKFTNCDGIFISLNKKCPQNLAKLCMLMNYFERCRVGRYLADTPVTIHRYHSLHPSSIEEWLASDAPLQPLTVNTTGFISDAGNGALEVDFANRWIGGGVLNRGAVQEEILFSTNPELLVTILLCGVMDHAEAIVVTGTEQFSTYSGYSRTLRFTGDSPLLSNTPTHVAMDATNVSRVSHVVQYSREKILREMNKAHAAFNHPLPSPSAPVSSGNWGCGAFGGHLQLKSMLQWAAASRVGRPLLYYTFGEAHAADMGRLGQALLDRGLTVGQLIEGILGFADQVEPADSPADQLFSYLMEQLV